MLASGRETRRELETKFLRIFGNHYPRAVAAVKIYDCKRRRCEANSGAISARRKRSRKYFMFTRRKIFLPVNYPVNIYEARRSDSLSHVCVMSHDSVVTTFLFARFYLTFKWLCSFRALPIFDSYTPVPFASRHANDSTSDNISGFEVENFAAYIRLRDVLALSPGLFLLPHLGSISFMRQFGNPVGIVKERKTLGYIDLAG